MTEAQRAARRQAWERYGYYVVFFSLWRPLPTFHGIRGWEEDDERRRVGGVVVEAIRRTVCGLVWHHWQRDGDNTYREIVHKDLFPAEHAPKFGRPCSRCWPG